MSVTNPLQMPRPREDVRCRLRVWNATEQGKDASSGGGVLVLGRDYLWLGAGEPGLSVPLHWITQVESVGPGFRVAWTNEANGQQEGFLLCVRTMFGYNSKRRDQVVALLRDAAASVAKAPRALHDDKPMHCDRCESTEVQLYDFERVTNFLVYWISRPDRRLLCPKHARSAVRAMLVRNGIMGTVGLPGLFSVPLRGLQYAKAAFAAGAVSASERRVLQVAAVAPSILVGGFIAWIVLLGLRG